MPQTNAEFKVARPMSQTNAEFKVARPMSQTNAECSRSPDQCRRPMLSSRSPDPFCVQSPAQSPRQVLARSVFEVARPMPQTNAPDQCWVRGRPDQCWIGPVLGFEVAARPLLPVQVQGRLANAPTTVPVWVQGRSTNATDQCTGLCSRSPDQCPQTIVLVRVQGLPLWSQLFRGGGRVTGEGGWWLAGRTSVLYR